MEKPAYEFWNIPGKYRDMYYRNMKAAQGLQKKYDTEIIFAAIRSEHFKQIYHIGLKAYGPRGWKYNPLATEAVKRYHKEAKQRLKLAKKADKNRQIELDYESPQPESKEVKQRAKAYSSHRKITLKQLRDMK